MRCLPSIKCVGHIARARLKDRHQENLHKKLEVLIAEQGVARVEDKAKGLQAQESESTARQDELSSCTAAEKNENSHSE